jgi:PleD family two-component response regulator
MKNILIVDDSPTLRLIIKSALDSFEFKLHEAETGQKGLDILNQIQIDLVLLDWYMPEMNGYQMFQKMKETEHLKDIPVLMISASDDKKNMLSAIRAGIKHYLIKPFTPEDLKIRVLQVLGLD